MIQPFRGGGGGGGGGGGVNQIPQLEVFQLGFIGARTHQDERGSPTQIHGGESCHEFLKNNK
jgi:hypothetical protein